MSNSTLIEDRVRREAHRLWTLAGQPSDREAEFWRRACDLIDRTDQPLNDLFSYPANPWAPATLRRTLDLMPPARRREPLRLSPAPPTGE